jgi:sugar/nucleoside kinase (ribokinase family)
MDNAVDLITIDKSWVDMLLRLPRLPGFDDKVLAELIGRRPGGMGGNVACTAARLGLRVGMVSWVGDDADGRLVQEDLHRFGVDTSHLLVEPGTTTNYTVILLTPSGEKSILVVPTAFNRLALDAALSAYLSAARLVYTTAYDLDQVARVAALVRAAGGLLVVDAETAAGLPGERLAPLRPLVDILFVPATIVPGADLPTLARELVAGGPQLVLITAGAQGVVAANKEQLVSCPAFAVTVADSTGAGDCFAGAFLAAFARGRPLTEALPYAQAAAALAIQTVGVRDSLPTEGQIWDFLGQQEELLVVVDDY